MNKEIHLTKKDFIVDYFSGTGAGGQHRNKHMNCCRITHKDTGLSASSQEHKSQLQNKKTAFRKLAKILIAYLFTEEEEARNPSASMGQKYTRTYKETKDLVVDHLTGEKFSYSNTVGKGDMSKLIEARLT